jgi:hypothetical protein
MHQLVHYKRYQAINGMVSIANGPWGGGVEETPVSYVALRRQTYQGRKGSLY